MIALNPATKSDAAFLADLEAEAMASHAIALWGQFLPAALSSFDLGATRIVLQAGVPVGCVTVERSCDHLRLRKLYLTAGVQGQGIGARVLGTVRQEARAAGLPLRLSVLTPNRRALGFYLREGLSMAETTPERIFLQAG